MVMTRGEQQRSGRRADEVRKGDHVDSLFLLPVDQQSCSLGTMMK
jgi:hypothetical protein